MTETRPTDAEPMTDMEVVASVAVQMGPLLRPDGEPFGGDLQLFTEHLTAYFAQNLERFADPRGGDVFVAVSVKRGGESHGHEYRSGHYVKAEDVAAALADPAPSNAVEATP